jgi:multiple sugar transport system substrate-binding protein
MAKRRNSPGLWCRVLISFILLILSASGCAGRATPTPTPEPVTLQFSVVTTAGESIAPYEKLAEAFHTQYPWLTVRIRPMGYPSRFQGELAVGADVELSYRGYDKPEAALPLDPYLDAMPAAFREDFLPNPLAACRQDGRTVCLPAAAVAWAVYYNQDLFDQLKIPYPQPGWTWDDFLKTAQALTADTTGGKRWGIAPPDYYDLFIIQEAGGDHWPPEGVRLDSAPILRAFGWYTGLAMEHGVMPKLNEYYLLWQGGSDPMLDGRIAMWLGATTANEGKFDAPARKFRVGVAPLPRGTYDVTFLYTVSFTISASSKHPEDAWRWIVFLSDHTPNLVATIRGVPARRSQLESAVVQAYYGKEQVESLRSIIAAGDLITIGSQSDLYYTALWDALEDVMTNGMPVADALRKAQKRLDEAEP